MSVTESRRKFIINCAYFAICIGLFYLFMKYAMGMFFPFILAFFIAILLQRPVNAITKRVKVGKGFISSLFVLLSVFVVGTAIAFGFYKLFSELKGFFDYILMRLEDAPLFVAQTKEWLQQILSFLPGGTSESISVSVATFLEKLLGLSAAAGETVGKGFDFSILSSPLGAVWGTAKQIPMLVLATVITIVSCCFMTADYHNIREMILTQAGENKGEMIVKTKKIVFSTLGKLVKAYMILISVTFVEMLIGLMLLKVMGFYESNYIFAICFVTAIVDVLPVLGTGTILVPWGVWSLCTGNIGFGIGILILYAVITIIRQIIEPKLVAQQLGLPAFMTIMAMYIGTQLFGFIGLFLLPVTIVILKVLNDEGIIHIFKIKKSEAALEEIQVSEE
ncbi:MAG: sporulation integral membrane protein YtvI [Oscillospiraceae bacterium]